ncbi:helix-turn-helix domain-containing protein [Halorhabdus sp. BNX81]|uniref:TrmB family transcriptional regulator n=1 Tax=Halorhabdus sp. BNX81 TaxID=2980181 RepID=UPI0023DCF350|nr:helix-turn-helix domain-containing protein [Halorhabdus sp. BNX81]WEL21735.1 Sugar-specific transcriptional regulator TrmB [Halorhabdus sp. BNX81]
MVNLCDLGLSSYEDQAYRTMLGHGPVSAMDLAQASDVPEGRIYDVLDSLETRGLVRCQTHSRPKQYLAVEPEAAIDRLVETRSRELREEINRYEVVGNRLIDELSADGSVSEQFLTTAIGVEDATELLLERIAVADEQVVMVADIFTSEFDVAEMGPDILDHIADAIERGVDVSMLVPHRLVDAVPGGFIDRIEREPFTDDGFAVRTTDQLYGAFFLLDHVELCFDVVNPMERDAMIGLINVKDPSFALELESQFRKHWEEATRYEPGL